MHLGRVLAALVGFGSLSAAAPAAVGHNGDSVHVSRASKNKRLLSVLSSPLVLQNQSHVGTVNIGQLGAINQLAQISQFNQLVQIAEAQLLAQVQSQVLLASQLQTIKDNIRINTFKARYPQVNTVLVTVTNVVDARNPLSINNRYLLNNLLIDNGFANQQQVIMVTDAQTMTITADATAAVTETATATQAADVTSALDIAALLSSALVARATEAASAGTSTSISADATASADANIIPASTFSVPLGVGSLGGQVISQQSTIVTAFNPASPFGFLNQSGNSQVLLPYDTAAPSSQLILADPASIIFAGNHNLLVQSIGNLQADCLSFGLGGNAFLGGASGLALFGSAQQAITAQLTTIQIGTRVQAIPPSILLSNPSLAAALQSAQASAFTSVSGSTTTDTATATATATATSTASA